MSTTFEQSERTPVYVIIGANGGIGSEVCRSLIQCGASVVAASRNPEKLGDLAAATGVQTFCLDATVSEQVERCFTETVERHGRIDGVAHCVGSLLLKPAHLTNDEDWAATLGCNLTSAFLVVRSAVRAMMKTGGGSIVLISSAAARVGLANHEAIGAAKAGIIGLALATASTYAPQKIRVNVVAPGLVRTPLTRRLTTNNASLKASTAMHPLGRLGEPSDIAAAVGWLLDPRQSWLTGQVLGVDGGLSSVRPRAES